MGEDGKSKVVRGKYPRIIEQYNGEEGNQKEDYSPRIEWIGFNGRPFIFKRSDFFAEDE